MTPGKVIPKFKTLSNKYLSLARSKYEKLRKQKESAKWSNYLRDAEEKLESAKRLYESKMYTYALLQALSSLESTETVEALIKWYSSSREYRRSYMDEVIRKTNSQLVSLQNNITRRERLGLNASQLDIIGFIGFQFLWLVNSFNTIVYLAKKRFWRHSMITRLEGFKHYINASYELLSLSDQLKGEKVISYNTITEFTRNIVGKEIIPRAASIIQSRYPSRIVMYLTRRIPLLVQYSSALMNYLENIDRLPVLGILIQGVFTNAYAIYEDKFSNKSLYELREYASNIVRKYKGEVKYLCSLHFYEVAAYNLVVGDVALKVRDTKTLKIALTNALINALALEGTQRILDNLLKK